MRLPQKLQGFSLFELLVVMAILGILVIVFLTTYGTSRQNQALRVSAEEVADKIREAHIFSREQKNDVGWGIRKSGDNSYDLIKGEETAWISHSSSVLESDVTFDGDFFIWFDPGSGETVSTHTINLINQNGHTIVIEVLESGVTEVGIIS
ncbi:Tfp pilus assembly protein FimT/FimU [Patescibacteria group bacterium]